MSKKNSIVISLVVLIVILASAVIFSGSRITVARCIVADSRTVFMVYGDIPIQLNGVSVKDYQTGDKLFIVHASTYAESYPEQTAAKFVFKISGGTESDVSEKAMNILRELKYIDK